MQFFAFLAAILNVKLEVIFKKCVENQPLQPMVSVVRSMMLK